MISDYMINQKKGRVQIAPARHQVTLLNTGNICMVKDLL